MTTHPMDHTTLSLTDIRAELDAIGREAEMTFGGLSGHQLNWRPDPSRWSVAQCFAHLLAANALMFRAAEDALDDRRPRTIWQRLPVVPALLGRMMVRSQGPGAARKFTAPTRAQPAASDIDADIIARFVEQKRDAVAKAQALDEAKAARTIMASPFVKVVTYSVLDGWRLVVAHDRRHFEQARRVTQMPEFPRP
jgi:DinB superfamily